MKAALLVQLGTPDKPEKADVKRYLKEFLNDPRVIDFPALKRTILVNGIIIQARLSNSTEIYKKVFTDKGSPLLFHTSEFTKKLQKEMDSEYLVKFAMRYQNPSVTSVLAELEKMALEELIVVPLYPQYASSSTGSTTQKVLEIVSKWETIPNVRFVNKFFENEGYLNCVAEQGSKHDWKSYDKVVFSFHGLPERHIAKGCKVANCKAEDCISKCDDERKYCYRSSCYETARQVAARMNIPDEKYAVVFQSRLGKDPWIQPFADVELVNLAKAGAKKLLFFSPAFVADCLETIVEIGTEYQEIFQEHGGEKVQLVESLNSNDSWVKALEDIIKKIEPNSKLF